MDFKLATIVVTYNAGSWINRCLQSILDSTISSTIIVVDNNSTDDTIAILEKKYPGVTLIKSQQNLGFAKGNNLGIKKAFEMGCDYIALLNQDAKFEKDCLKKLMEYSALYPAYGILAPLTFSYDGQELDPFHLGKSFTGNLRLASDVYFHREEDVYEIELAPAAVWLLKAEAILDAGVFDPLFFMYGEDNDLWERFKYRGWKTGIFPKALAYHHHNAGDWKKLHKRILLSYSEIVLRLKNPANNFAITLLKVAFKNILLSVYSLVTFNLFNLKILWSSGTKVLSQTFMIYRHRKISINEKSAFL